ncbi:hypothetical protein V7148_16970 [Gottfriedia acidiceleris]|uniref:hypothetical protein n=1 Tax=Bacillaceae TaxID=186817 RepID=UPI000BED16BD|nr:MULTISPECIES: hypothetical protein [unclassified Bacillus (in: firmicutes)]PEC48834.1 hypothetical protein CON00_14755 [Bacillus sp. AFS096315]PFM82854.1 hypothetical protein COJ46_03330 [Bacillus sp. AFS077874]
MENNPISDIKHTLQQKLDQHNPSVTYDQIWNKANSNRGYNRIRKPFVSVGILLFLAITIFINSPIKNALKEDMGITKEYKSTSAESSFGLLIVNGAQYRFERILHNDEFILKDQIGEVKEVIINNTIPKVNFSSNMLKVGDKIYLTNEDPNVMIVKQEDGTILKFLKTEK